MAAIISIAVGVAGSLVGAAIGTAIGGTILGIGAATIGSVIGAGIAGGLLSSYNGGDFGKGFLMGAAGGAIGAFAKAGIGALTGGATEAGLAGAEGATTGAATTGALEGIGTTGGLEGLTSGAEAATLGEGSAVLGSSGNIGMGTAASGTAGAADASGFSLESLGGGADAFGGAGTFDTGATTSTTPSSGLNSMAMNQGNLTQGNLTTPSAGGFNVDPTESTYGLTGSDKLAGADYSTGTASPAEGFTTPAEATTGSSTGGSSMFEKSDNWLGENLGMGEGSTAKLAKGGLEYLYKNYQANKLDREVNKLKPLTFDQYAAQFTDPGAYKQAAATMAKSGRTGALPALLARMKNDARAKYAGYLQPQQEKYLAGQAGLANVRTSNLSGLFNTLGSTGIGF